MELLLVKEQQDDDAKKAWCEHQLDTTEDELKALNQHLADLDKAIQIAKDNMATLASEIAALIAGVKALDKSVNEATENRKAENSDFNANMAANKAAKELIGLAKNRMNQFYNPSLYIPPAHRELSQEQRIAVRPPPPWHLVALQVQASLIFHRSLHTPPRATM